MVKRKIWLLTKKTYNILGFNHRMPYDEAAYGSLEKFCLTTRRRMVPNGQLYL
jgi:hypothetical protein